MDYSQEAVKQQSQELTELQNIAYLGQYFMIF